MFYSFQLSFGSYLGYPRIHFAGQIRADSDTRNNDRCNYRLDKETNPDLNDDWGVNGTNEIQFFNATITSFINKNGIRSNLDPVVNHTIIGNLLRPFAKLTDLDVDCQDHSTIYGLNFGIKWNNEIPDGHNDIAFYGKWTRNVIAQYMWPRLKCYSKKNHGAELYQDSFPFGAQSTTTITNIQWDNLKNSEALSQLQDAAGSDGNLAVRISVFYYTRNYPPYVAHNATLGYVVGVIGVPSPSDTLNVPGDRSMSPTSNTPSVTYDDTSDLCYQQDLSSFMPWMNTAPFEVDEERNEVHLDLSNSIPTDLNNNLRNIGDLYLGILMDSCIYLLGEESIPYNSNDLLNITSGIYTITVDSSLMDDVTSSLLVVVQLLDNGDGTAICGEALFSGSSHTVLILLQEETYFLRPKDYYVGRLDRDTQPSTTHTLYVTKYGRAERDLTIALTPYNALGPLGPPLPINGILPTSWISTSDENGFTTFEFRINATIPPIREYIKPPCLKSVEPDRSVYLPIDGQVYYFQFCVYSVDSEGNSVCDNSHIYFAFLAFSDVNYTRPYTWKKDVEPIFAQFARMAPIMSTILNMSSYEDVTKSHSISLLNLTLRLSFEDPSFMPTTRDLSPTKRRMILEWLEDPQYEDNVYTDPDASAPICLPPHASSARPESPKYPKPPRCKAESLRFTAAPQEIEPYFDHVFNPVPDSAAHLLAKRDSLEDINIPGRPLLGQVHKGYFLSKKESDFDDLCTVHNIKEQLQTAIQLEWATIPTYLTSLYSIIDGCNDEIYELIRSIVMQEMLHMTQAANILIALNGKPRIDDVSMTPSFPGKLPGGVLPNLTIHLEKLSLSHVHDTFMAIETPEKSFVVPGMSINNSNLTTIGVFYEEISDCINEHDDSIFDPSTLTEQVKWPWEYNSSSFGYLVPVTNVSSAREAIKMIIDQGEGAGILSPDQNFGEGELAHFYKFEEIVCGRHLKKINPIFYSYSGDPIPFNPRGVWPMRSNPSICNIPPHTNCYTESRNFHTTYRKLLKNLQEVFNGHPDEIFVAVKLMESLQVHAKKLMWTKFHPDSPDDDTTCGPVWEYEWPEDGSIKDLCIN